MRGLAAGVASCRPVSSASVSRARAKRFNGGGVHSQAKLSWRAPLPAASVDGGAAQDVQQPSASQAAAADPHSVPAAEHAAAGKEAGGSGFEAAAGAVDAAATQPAQTEQRAGAPKQSWRSRLQQSWRILQQCSGLLKTKLWPLVIAHAVTDAAVFLLHRFSHRATNEVAVRLLGGGLISPAAIGNMWWLSVDPAIANFQTGYQLLTFAFFLLAFPLNVAIKTWASCATILLCQQAHQGAVAVVASEAQQQQEQKTAAEPAAADAEPEQQPKWWQLRRGLQQASRSLGALRGQISALWRPVFVVELLVAAVVVPAQFASLAVVTLPLTLPFILDLQATGPVAALEGLKGIAAIKRSRQLLKSLGWQLAVPFVGLVVAGRLLEGVKAALLNAMPPRYYQELVELPLAVLVGGSVLSLLIARLQDVLPFVAFTEGKAAEVAAAAGDGKEA